MQRPRTRYAISHDAEGNDVRIAWQQFGGEDAAVDNDLVVVPGFASHVDQAWELRSQREFQLALASHSRVTTFDKRGVGMSDRAVSAPTLEERVDDLLAVMDAAEVERASLLGISEGCPMAILFAAAHPERVDRLVLYGGMARTSEAPGYPFAPPKEALIESALELMLPHWDEPVLMEIMQPSKMDDPEYVEQWVRYQQASVSPDMVTQLYLMALDFDVRDLLPGIQVPTLVMHRKGDRAVPVQGARWMAAQIPGAVMVELDGIDHGGFNVSAGELTELERFVTGSVTIREPDRALMTVLFTDIVASTEKATALGDAAWRAVLARHDELVTTAVEAHRGVLRKNLGDGAMATFDGPARAVRAGLAAAAAVAPLGLELRVGVHCGEVELVDDDVAGIAVHLAARVADKCRGGQVVATSTVADLAAGSGLTFEDLGEHVLKGMDRAWRLFSVSDPTASA